MRLFFWLCLLVAALTAAPGDATAMSTSSTRLAAESLQDTPAAEPPCNSPSGFDCPTTTDDGYVYAYDTATKSFVRVPIATAGSPDPQATYRYTLTPACPRAQPFDDVNCVGAAEFCAQSGATGIHEDLWREETQPVSEPWRIVNQICVGPGDGSLPLGDVEAAVSEYERDHMPIPVPNVQPANVAIVNLPVLVSVPQAGPQTMQVQQPVPGLLVATPTYTWKFDDGATVTGAGLPYDGTDPRVDPGHYVSHTYTAAEAQASVTLTVTWTATFTVAGQAFTIPPLIMPPITNTFSVHEAHAVLVSGNEP